MAAPEEELGEAPVPQAASSATPAVRPPRYSATIGSSAANSPPPASAS
ncbi:MAG TPA: hypothetical protein VGS06_18105 [Streptosporangiaceae bacterium]|nr:hypothetical protein [Streptosporangiaceae bacterium]